MKIPHLTPLKAAFTLIELLVVISIIAVLASLSIPAISSAMVNAKKAQAKNDMAQIANAIKLYYTEYGRYPIDSTTVTQDTDAVYGSSAKDNEPIISVLRYKTSTGSTPASSSTQATLNPRQIKFIEPKVTAVAKGGVYKSDGKWYDPWGKQYLIFIDADYDSEIAPTGTLSGLDVDGDNKVPVSVGVASVGYFSAKFPKQSASLPRAYNKTTDLLSWQ